MSGPMHKHRQKQPCNPLSTTLLCSLGQVSLPLKDLPVEQFRHIKAVKCTLGCIQESDNMADVTQCPGFSDERMCPIRSRSCVFFFKAPVVKWLL